jgi:hypothetical protein
MKKWIIGSFVGAILVFGWQFLSWNILGIHNAGEKYTPAQDSIINVLSTTLKEDGMYLVPTTEPGADMKARDELAKKMDGKPYAGIIYVKSFETGMTKPIIRGFLIDLALVLLMISILVRGGLPSFTGIFTGCIAVGLFTFLWQPYMELNWFQVPWPAIKGHLIDAIVAWGLCGLWLAWWLRK